MKASNFFIVLGGMSALFFFGWFVYALFNATFDNLFILIIAFMAVNAFSKLSESFNDQPNDSGK